MNKFDPFYSDMIALIFTWTGIFLILAKTKRKSDIIPAIILGTILLGAGIIFLIIGKDRGGILNVVF